MSDKKGNGGGFLKFLYNSDTGEVLGRTGISWAKIIIFYIIFYLGLAAFFGIMLYIFYCTLDPNHPKYQQEDSLIGINPGIGFRPQPDQDSNVDSTLIWFNKNDAKDYQFWSNQLQNYVEEARRRSAGGKTCNFAGTIADDKNACDLTASGLLGNLGNCQPPAYGYDQGSPCVLIKLNRIFNWEPKALGKYDGAAPLTTNDIKLDTKDDKQVMTEELKAEVVRLVNAGTTAAERANRFKSVWIDCRGENPADRENMGKIAYWPDRYIPYYYFPFKKQKNYASPFVMVHFMGVTPGVLINIECRAYAEDIKFDKPMRLGGVHFELMVE